MNHSKFRHRDKKYTKLTVIECINRCGNHPTCLVWHEFSTFLSFARVFERNPRQNLYYKTAAMLYAGIPGCRRDDVTSVTGGIPHFQSEAWSVCVGFSVMALHFVVSIASFTTFFDSCMGARLFRRLLQTLRERGARQFEQARQFGRIR